MLFSNIRQFKESVGGAANVSIEMDSITPTIRDTFDLHLRPWLGDEISDTIISNYEDNALTPQDSALLPKVRNALAKLTMHEYSKIGGVQFSESGMHRVETENVKSTFKYQEEEYKSSMLENGYEAIETMLKFLTKKAEDYPEWQQGDGAFRHNATFLRYASELRKYYGLKISRYTYECLRPLIEEVECFAVESIMSEGLYGDLKTKYVAGILTPNEAKAVELIQRIITEFAIFEGLQRHWLQVDGNRVIHTEHTGDQLRSTRTAANAQSMSLAIRHHELMANRWVSKFMHFITNHESEFPLAFCQDGYWADEAEYWTDSEGQHWAYLKDESGTRCYAKKDASKTATDCCCQPQCPDRHPHHCGTEISTRSCGCGCGGSCGCSSGGSKKRVFY